ncbi:class I SAM-dependent methyltransferase [Microlunatus soli]|uniref:Methyltransferase domain-containing protein n=1 Tax=Microlunatus soli TaxID=630515 RepID=A0A1H1USF5_9ACTN|nr:class I SAM-dependent methyltransferase [Microlunatus soli]SDS75220.1 Methyltransferase domain-containing protein [Microlunatus soli]
MKRSLSFGSVAEAYERYRPGYPDRLAELIIEQAASSGAAEIATAIEIGAGTGKATRVIAAAGIAVTATEPDPAMLAVLERACDGLGVGTVCAAFEDPAVDDLGPVDLLYAAAALHWTDPQGRWDRIARLVRPGGLVASFGGPTDGDAEVAAIEQQVLAEHGVQVTAPGPIADGTTMEWPGNELLADDRFTDVRETVLPRRLRYTRDDFLGLLNTISAYRTLDDPTRAAVFAELDSRLPAEIDLAADLTMHTARRVGVSPGS